MSSKAGAVSGKTPSSPSVKESNGNDEWDQYLVGEIQRVKAERNERLIENGMLPFLKLPEGETEVHFFKELPRDVKGTYGIRKGFHVRVNGQDYLFAINSNSPVYSRILEKLQKGETTIKIVRAGTGQMTRYSVIG